MPLVVYRICDSKYSDDLSGNGAKLYGGRWNSKGNTVIYCSGSKSLAVLELLVHTSINILPKQLRLITISVPEKIKIQDVSIKNLPGKWKVYPSPFQNQILGDKWLKSKSTLILKIPSVIIPSEFNFLINPLHKDISSIKIVNKEIFEVDDRLYKNIK